MRPKDSTTAVVILNWHNAEDTIACLQSVRDAGDDAHAVVVDNASTDGSAQAIEATGLAHILLHNSTNGGYAGGNNLGLRWAIDQGYSFVVVLNNDTLVQPGTFSRIREVSAHHRAVVSPRIVYADSSDDIWFAGGTVDRGLPRHLSAAEIDGARGVMPSETLSGCFIGASAETWSSVGLFDERYFLIFEDSDWSARARAAGHYLVIDQETVLWHKVSRSFTGHAMSLISTFFYVRNGLRYMLRHQRKYLWRFIWRPTVTSVVSPRPQPVGRRLFALLALFAWITGQTGNAPARAWPLARKLERANLG